MTPFTSIIIIYNPNSTGPGKKLAHALARKLHRAGLKSIVSIVPTEHAGHGEQLAYTYAMDSPKPLIVSSSGDGGYNEVINGAMKAQAEGAKVTTGLLPAGNANDHYNDLHTADTAELIIQGRTSTIDLLQIITERNSKIWSRYAHSYIGIGLTPHVGNELNKVDLNPFNEKWIALKAFYMLEPVRLLVQGKIRKYDSVVMANIGKMSKVLSLSDSGNSHDGRFELITFKHQKKSKLMLHLFQAATKGLQTTNRRTRYTFETLEPITIQLDGEISKISSNAKATVKVMPKILSCIV